MVSEFKKSKVNKATKVQVNRFLRAVGWFVTIFSIVERNVHEALWNFTKVDPVIARCIFSGTRMDAAIGQLKRIVPCPASEATARGFPFSCQAIEPGAFCGNVEGATA
jgi:hypothetical protein